MTKQTLQAEANGRNGKIKFDINIDNNEIKDIKVTKSSETPAIFNQVFDKLKNSKLSNFLCK
ncbi:FMN-binding protein [Lactobacillus jensenii]|uniref:FMN-binding protein n=1 Tax=Lactobacillus jensenii TaxID=109790 RepID=UPI0022AC2AC5|nr:FMN-binding protein [Lactobacillus jensenii]MCZ4012568.1 FMN-binding protein [Lactobacillus jensenii]